MSTWDDRHRPGDGHGLAADSSSFRKLCRSSPWRWETLQCEYWDEPFISGPSPGAVLVRAWVKRPGALRVEDVDGVLLESSSGGSGSRAGLYTGATRKSWLLPPQLVTPVYDDAGLVTRRPEAAYGDPGFGSGCFSAALDPVELTGNVPVPIEFPGSNPVLVTEVVRTEQDSRPALEAIVVPTAAYHPAHQLMPLCLPGRTLIRIDLQTGICVASRSLEPATAQHGHWLRIIEVDGYCSDQLFDEPGPTTNP